ncbi:MAG TPA: MaoC/PaaZ C-terminal domain-containing protein [Actinomycetota bacterium]|nr:MaoC/PaaZ C-terminal domain-containing protein [Actinomycetota bacterium]
MSERRVDTQRIFPTTITLEGITPGMELEERVFGPVDREDFVRYAAASGDDNPIHQDEEYARKSGAPTVFAMGMLNAGYLAKAVSDWFGGPHHIRRYKVRFTNRVWPGDEVVCTGKVTAIEDGLVKVSLEVRRRGTGPAELNLDEEQTAITGEADIELPA